jgi:DNA-binding transcriptional LysR family regulator
MDLRQLRHFLAVIDQRNYGRAADAVGITQQALSHSVATLEKRLQARLFDRGKFGAEPTQVGRMLEKRARLICSEAEFATAEVTAFKGGVEGQIAIGVTQNFAGTIMPEIALSFGRARPKVRLSVTVATSKQLFDMILGGKIELAITSPIGGVDSHFDLEHHQIDAKYVHNPNFLVLNPTHPLLKHEVVSISDLGAYPWCMPESWLTPWEEIFAAMRNAGAEAPDHVIRTDSLTFAKALLMHSQFICLLGYESVMAEVRTGLLAAIELPLTSRRAAAFVSHRKGHQLQAAAAPLIDCATRALRDLSNARPLFPL